MNQTEQWYHDEVLQRRVRNGELRKVYYEAVTFKMADRATYTPDFYCLRTDGGVEIHETKGYWREDDRVKIKVCASMFDEFYWYGVRIAKQRGVWKILKTEEF